MQEPEGGMDSMPMPPPNMPMDGAASQGMPPMGDNQQMNGQMPMGNEDEDADNDPKKEIQKLSGELSQQLNNYNSEQQNPDVDLNKYVGGMIIKQIAKGLTDKDKKEIAKKLNSGDFSDEDNLDDEMPSDENPQQQEPQQPQPQMESKYRKVNKLVDEIMGNILNDDKPDEEDRYEKKITNKEIGTRSPFISRR